MKLPLTLSLVFAALVHASSFSFKRIKHQPHYSDIVTRAQSASGGQVVTSNPNSAFSLSTIHDLIYLVNITVGGQEYSVQLDTGSSDLWIKGNVHPLPGTTPTNIPYNITYVMGWASGQLSYAPVEFIGLKVPKQAFMDVDQANNPVLGYGLQGIVGLGFTSLSNIDYAVNQTSSSDGRSLLYNMFAVNPSEPNFLAFSLLRSTEAGDEVEGSFSIGEYEPEYASIANTSRISTWPVHNPKRWTVLLDSVIIGNDITVPTTQLSNAPSNKAVVLMDSGASYTYAPKSITDLIYGNITGAQFDDKSNQWVVPCDYEIDMALQIGGQVFPLHPIDVTPATAGNNSTCVGSFIPNQLEERHYDWLIGDNFLRSVYAVYDFGDFDDKGVMGDPYIRFLSTINPDQASADFHTARGGTPKHNITYTGLNASEIAPSFFISDDVSNSLEMIGKFMPAMLGIVALNALILLGLVVGGLIHCMKKRRINAIRTRTRSLREQRGRLTPMPLNNIPSYIAGEPSSPSSPHVYQPVSMALTEDTFVPPAPAFHKFDSSVLPGDRPKSIA
ncbi:acid protease [Macrolepiota fuliginosa MF-IS2]|uniref:Acid protease n=1 Tax=Macrolepiota fuliginosa MF-IS2 TaxID=1400762 RepID=A0A9P5XL66_9AGAR|nr:acid protease [Macrolepiota fuliginosa MF-IS2]